MVSIMADSYLRAALAGGGEVTKSAAARKIDKCSTLPSSYIFQPLAFENLEPIDVDTLSFLVDLGRRRSSGQSGDVMQTAFLFQRLSVTTQRLNSVLPSQSFISSHFSTTLMCDHSISVI